MKRPPELIDVGWSCTRITERDNKAFDCAEMTMINTGTQNVTIQATHLLQPGQSMTFPCFDPREVNRTVYNFEFANQSLPGCELTVWHKKVMWEAQ